MDRFLLYAARGVASLIGIGLLGAMLFGYGRHATWIGADDKSLRQVAIAGWCVAVPAWFIIEDALFTLRLKKTQLAAFREGQRRASIVWTAIGGIIAAIVGFQLTYADVDVPPGDQTTPAEAPAPVQ